MVDMNIFYKMDLQICDPKSEFLTKTENSGFLKYEHLSCWIPELTSEAVSKIEMTLK